MEAVLEVWRSGEEHVPIKMVRLDLWGFGWVVVDDLPSP